MHLLFAVAIFCLFHASQGAHNHWIKINVSTIEWSELKVYRSGDRRLFCGNIDKNYTGKYHWRFNGSSVLPDGTQSHKHQITFSTGANAIRDHFIGTYDCCVRESLGNACYATTLLLKDFPSEIGMDISESNVLYVPREGDSVLIRLVKSKKLESVQCHLNNETAPLNLLYSLHSKKKGNDYYQLKIDHFSKSNIGEYNCSVRLRKQDVRHKAFRAYIGEPPVISFASKFTTFFFVLLTGVSFLYLF